MDYRTVPRHMCLNSGLSVHEQLVTLVDSCNTDNQARTTDLTEPVHRKPTAEQKSSLQLLPS